MYLQKKKKNFFEKLMSFFWKLNTLHRRGWECPFPNVVPFLAFSTLPFFKSRMNLALHIARSLWCDGSFKRVRGSVFKFFLCKGAFSGMEMLDHHQEAMGAKIFRQNGKQGDTPDKPSLKVINCKVLIHYICLIPVCGTYPVMYHKINLPIQNFKVVPFTQKFLNKKILPLYWLNTCFAIFQTFDAFSK